MHEFASTPSSEQESWLISAKNSRFIESTLLPRLEQEPEVDVERVLRLSDDTVILVVAMREETAQQYREEFGSECHIERNRPLQSFR